jgi:hypothetical protein
LAKKQKQQSKNMLVTFILDSTGSMESKKGATLEGFNTYLTGLKKDQKDNGGKVEFTLVEFDSARGVRKTHFKRPVEEVPSLTEESYTTDGMTPLVDAAFNTIRALEAAIDQEKQKPEDVVVCIQTDGEENYSREHTWASLKELIDAKIKAGWHFNFMGAGIDAYKQANMMGIGASNTVSYSIDAASTRMAFAATTNNLAAVRSGAKADMSYTASQKAASGDKFTGVAGTPAGQTNLYNGPIPGTVTGVLAATKVDLGGGAAPERKKTDVDLSSSG